MKPAKILILEDDVLAARDLRDTLHLSGYPMPALCRDIDSALNLLNSLSFDLAILDIKLENQRSGLEIAKVLHQDYSLPFIFLTSHDDDENFRMAMETKPAAYLIKPFRARELDLQIRVAYSNWNKELTLSSGFSPYLFLPVQGGIKKLTKADIVYLQAKKFSTDVYLVDSPAPERFSVNIGYLEQFLGDGFVRISRSNIVNLKYMDEINNGTVTLTWPIEKKISLVSSPNSKIMKVFPVIRRK